MTASLPILEVRNLCVSLPISGRMVPVVTDLSLSIASGEAVALVGESGCGKSMTARAIIGLPPPGATVSGSIRLEGSELTTLSPRERRRVGGRGIGFIFQEPMTSLHPTLSIGQQMADSLRYNLGLPARAARDRAKELLARVGLPKDRDLLNAYVHELSGGMRQRVMIAIAISCNPKLVIADEPTTALDVTIQAQVLDLLIAMRAEIGLAMLYISHDLEVVAEFCDRAIVMYAGDQVEAGTPIECLKTPHHPYTRGLVDAIPHAGEARTRLSPIPGQVPQLGSWPSGCRFQPRCPRQDDRCARRPELASVECSDVRCWHPLVGEVS
jgi:oligopeptide/dipeptide ABC transporter ATP-binding protein